jgi:hypothetical protein
MGIDFGVVAPSVSEQEAQGATIYTMWRCGKANKKRQSITNNILYYACAEEMSNIVMRAHIYSGLGGRDEM